MRKSTPTPNRVRTKEAPGSPDPFRLLRRACCPGLSPEDDLELNELPGRRPWPGTAAELEARLAFYAGA